MTREQLEHAIRAACDVSGDNEVYIFGSQAILGEYPEAPASLRQSIEVDVSPVNKPDASITIDGALGERSLFHQTHGFYVHGVSLESAVLPNGWKSRTNEVHDYIDPEKTGHCVESHDLAASKLMAFREKDTEFVRQLLVEEMISSEKLLARLKAVDNHEEQKERAINWIKRTAKELD